MFLKVYELVFIKILSYLFKYRKEIPRIYALDGYLSLDVEIMLYHVFMRVWGCYLY